MKVAIAGSHGVGKTTLTKSIAKIMGLPRIEEVARSVAKEFGFESNEQILAADKETIRLFQQRIFYRQLLAEDKLTDYISDRSIFDVIAYMRLYGLHDMADDFTPAASMRSSGYDMIVFCPVPNKEIANDGFRLTDSESQEAVSHYITSLLKTHAKCEVLFLPKDRDIWQKRTHLALMGEVKPV